MESKFITLNKVEEEAEGFDNFWRIYLYGLSQCHPYAFITIIK